MNEIDSNIILKIALSGTYSPKLVLVYYGLEHYINIPNEIIQEIRYWGDELMINYITNAIDTFKKTKRYLRINKLKRIIED